MILHSSPNRSTFELVDQQCWALYIRLVMQAGHKSAIHISLDPTPKTPQKWKRISEDVSTLWNFPHCLDAGDGKHVVIDCPKNSGSNFF